MFSVHCNRLVANFSLSNQYEMLVTTTFANQSEAIYIIYNTHYAFTQNLNTASHKKSAILVNAVEFPFIFQRKFPVDNLAEWNGGQPLGLRTVHAYVLVFDMGNLATFQVILISLYPVITS